MDDRCYILPSDWIKNIPQNWKLVALKHILKERDEIVSDKQFPPLSVSKSGILPQLANVVKTNAGDKRKAVYRGDFVINSRSDRKGASGLSAYEGSVSLICIVYQIEDIYSKKFIHYLLKSNNFIEEFYRNGHGIVSDLWTTRNEDVKNIILPIPPRNEQDKIVNFLDNKITNIDRLIAIKQRQIEQLKEKRQAIINKAVTKGIYPDVSMKDSGIGWIGEVPEDWEYKTLGDILQEQNIKNDSNTDRAVLSLSYGNIIKKLNVNEGLNPKDYSNYQIVHKGNIILRLTDLQNDQKSLRVGLANDEGIITSAYLCLKTSMDSKFIAYVLKFYDYIKLFYGFGAGVRQNMKFDDLKTIPIFIPPIEEQHMICEYIDKIIEKYSSLSDERIGLIKKSISLLHEYRTRLISDAVTGTIDVSNWKCKVRD